METKQQRQVDVLDRVCMPVW